MDNKVINNLQIEDKFKRSNVRKIITIGLLLLVTLSLCVNIKILKLICMYIAFLIYFYLVYKCTTNTKIQKIIRNLILCTVLIIPQCLIFIAGYTVNIIDGCYGIKGDTWLNYLGAIFGGLIGVSGGYMIAKEQSRCEKEIEKETQKEKDKKVKVIILSLLEKEINSNYLTMMSYYKEKDCNGKIKRFALNDWEIVKYELLKLQEQGDVTDIGIDLFKLYNLMEQFNNILDDNEDLNAKSNIDLLRDIDYKLSKMQSILIEYNKMI